MRRMEWGNDAEGIKTEIEMCLLYDEKDQEEDGCRGASGRKLRRVCIYCPNWQKWMNHRDKERKDDHGECEDDH